MIAIPVKELKDGAKISATCKEKNEPIYITKNGYSDMVIMSCTTFERYESAMRNEEQRLAEAHRELLETLDDIRTSDEQIDSGEGIDGFELLAMLKDRHVAA